TSMLARHLEPVTLEGPGASDPQSVARWLDSADVWLMDLDAQVRAIDKKVALLKELDPQQHILPSETVTSATFKAVYEVLERRANALDQALSEAQYWQSEFDILREQLADCMEPVRSNSLLKMKRENVQALLRRARVDDALKSLVPLCFR